jgi:hypothetical protein
MTEHTYTYTITVTTSRPLPADLVQHDVETALRGNPVTAAYNPSVAAVPDTPATPAYTGSAADHYTWAEGWGNIAAAVLGFHIPSIPTWRQAVIDGFLAGVRRWADQPADAGQPAPPATGTYRKLSESYARSGAQADVPAPGCRPLDTDGTQQ